MVPDREFKVVISGDARSLVKESGEGAQALESVNQKTGRHAENLEEASKKADKFELSHRNLRAGLGMLGPEVAEVGHAFAEMGEAEKDAAGGAMSLGGFFLLTAVLGEVVKLLEESVQQMRELSKTQAEMDVAKWEGVRDRMREAANSGDELAQAINRATENTNELKQAEDKALAVLQEQIKAKAALAGQDETRRKYIEAQGAEQKIKVLEDFLGQALSERTAAGMNLGTAEAARKKGPEHAEESDEAKKRLEKNKDDVEKAQEGLNNATDALSRAKEFPDTFKDSLPILEQNVKEAQQKLEQAKNSRTADQAIVDAVARQTKKLEEDERAASEKLQHWIKSIQEMTAELDKQKAVLAEQNKGAAALELQSAGLKPGSVAGQTVLGVINTEEAIAHGDKVSAAQADGIKRLQETLSAAGNNQKQINAIFQMMLDLHKGHDEKLQVVLDALRILKANQAVRTQQAGNLR